MGNVNGMTPQEAAARAKEDSFTLAALPGEKRDAALTAIAEALEAEKAALFAANGQDLEDVSDILVALMRDSEAMTAANQQMASQLLVNQQRMAQQMMNQTVE